MQKMTQHKDRQADAIEITPQMIEAGMRSLDESGVVGPVLPYGSDVVVREILAAALSRASFSKTS